MRKLSLLAITALLLGACVDQPTTTPRPVAPVVSTDLGTASARYARVTARVEPVAEQICRSFHADKPASFCDFQFALRNDPNEPANAFQSIGPDGRPLITFNSNMLKQVQNDDELAFVMAHEAGHQTAKHLIKSRNNQLLGGAVIGLLVGLGGGDTRVGVNIGTQIGGLAYSKKFELQADTIAVHITDRAGYNAERGVKELARTGGSNSFLSTHPASGQRVANAQAVLADIRRAKSQGRRAPIVW